MNEPPRARPTWCLVRLLALSPLALAPLTGCGHSPATQFYTLAAVRPDQPARMFAGSAVQVRAVHIPELLDRLERVSALSAQRLQIDQFQQWGAPLAGMIRRVLTEDLATRLPSGMVLPAQAPGQPGTRGVVVDVQEFGPQPDGGVVLDVGWTLLNGAPGRAPTRGQRRFELPSDPGADAQVAAMGRLLGQLADTIAASLTRS